MISFRHVSHIRRQRWWLEQAGVALAAVAVMSSVPSDAADVSWIATGSGNFSTGTNWSTGTVPGVADSAIIRNGGTAVLTLAGTSAGPRFSIGQDGEGTLLIGGGGTASTTGISSIGRSQSTGTAAGTGLLVIDGS